jgi:hypothetical protein
MINKNFLELVSKHAGNETKRGLSDVCHKFNAFMPGSDPGHEAFLSYLGHHQKEPNLFEYYTLTAERDGILKQVTPLINLAYLFALAEHYKKPIADLQTVDLDRQSGFPVALELKKDFDAYFKSLRKKFSRIKDHKAADRLFLQIIEAPLPVDNLDALACHTCWLSYFLSGTGIMRLPEIYLNRLNGFAAKINTDATAAKEKWFNKLAESLDRRATKHGKTKDYSGFIGVIRDLERRGKKFTKLVRGTRRFDADKIFKELPNMAKNTDAKPCQFNDYEIWIDERLDGQGDFFEPVIIQSHPDQKNIELSKESFQKHILSKITPA